MRLRLKILISILVSLVMVNCGFVVYEIRKDIQFNKELLQKEIKVKDQVILDIYKNINRIDKDVINVPTKDKINQIKIEQNLLKSVVMIHNKTLGGLGSGVTIKYKNNFYILSAGHMAETTEEIMSFSENGQEIGELEIIKHDYSFSDDIEDVSQARDLILLKPKNPNLVPKFYVELADFEPQNSTQIYTVGNPVGIEDVLSDGRLIQYNGNFVYYIGTTYYGNSGGGIFTRDGKLIGIVSHMFPYDYNQSIPAYMTYGAVRLNVIKEFLKDVI